MSSTYGQLKAGSLVLYDQTIEVTDLSLGDLQLQGFDTSITDRPRFTESECRFHFQHGIDKQDAKLQELVSGTATSTIHDSAYVAMVVAGGSDRVVRQSYEYISCIPGSTHYAVFDGVLSTSVSPSSDITTRFGLFDDKDDKTVDSGGNGVFVQYSGGVFSLGVRSSTQGSEQTDTIVTQANFNMDVLDGTGLQNILFDANKSHTFLIEFLSSVCVRFGLLDKGTPVYIHKFIFTGVVPAFKSQALPMRFEIENTAANGTDSDEARLFSGSVYSEHPKVCDNRVSSYNTGLTATSITGTRTPIMSLRLKSLYCRSVLTLKSFTVFTNGPTLLEVYFKSTLSECIWNTTDTNSIAEVTSSVASCTDGRKVQSAYVSSGCSTITLDPHVMDTITTDIAGQSFIISLCGTKLTSDLMIYCSVEWYE